MDRRLKFGIIVVVFGIFATFLVFPLDSNEVDELCDVDGSYLQRVGGEWVCADLSGFSGGGSAGVVLNSTDYVGSDCSGGDGDVGRVLLHGDYAVMVGLDNFMLHPVVDYSQSGGEVTFNVKVFDTQKVTVWTNVSGMLSSTNYAGSLGSGSDGDEDRVFTVGAGAVVVVLDRFALHPVYDYVVNGSQVTIHSKVWDSQVVTVWR